MTPWVHPATAKSIASLKTDPRGSYVCYGPTGVGRMTTLLWILRGWHGHDEPKANCIRCIQITAKSYPDLLVVSPEKDSFGIATVNELTKNLALLRTDNQGKRMVILDEAEKLTTEAQNALLKIIEEPPLETIIVLLATSPISLRETLRSRLQAISFYPASRSQACAYLESNGIKDAQLVAELASGVIGRAFKLASNEEFLSHLQQISTQAIDFISMPIFDRLVKSDELASLNAEDMTTLIECLKTLLQSRLRKYIQSSELGQVSQVLAQLSALDLLTQQRSANVSPKSALGRFALELG
ncbi:MAG: hypothetical protein ACHQUB_00770 [Candidatus Saccharimonadia bacterium]